MIVNPNVDGYTKTLIHRKTLRKTAANQNNTKTEL